MVNAFYAPVFWVLGRINFLACYLLVAALFLVPTLLALFPPAWLHGRLLLAVALLYGFALYVTLALEAFMSIGIRRLVQLTDRVAGGELVAVRRAEHGHGEAHDAALLWASVMRMNDSLKDIVGQVRGSAETVAAAAQGIVENNTQLSERTQEQAASLEETAAGVEQLAASARQNAASCEQANRLAGEARAVAATAAQRMQDMTATMREIDDNARRVAEILGTVEGIAFQTNILALNAAVEAARAGDQGRGFAVVAAEVRTLAQRSAAAAKEIKGLIGQATGSVDKGRGLADAVAATMGSVVAGVEDVSGVLASIAAASAQQSAGVQEINNAIVQIDMATQQNAALVEEAASGAAALQQEAARMLEGIGRFKTDRSQERGRVVQLVQKGARHLRKHGVQRACRDFMDRNGAFVHDEDYLVVLDFQGTRLAFAPDPASVGSNDMDIRDVDGRLFTRELLEIARTSGSGWCDYRMRNPRTGRVAPKSMYFERVGEVVVGCGIYSSEDEAAPRTPRAGSFASPARLGISAA